MLYKHPAYLGTHAVCAGAYWAAKIENVRHSISLSSLCEASTTGARKGTAPWWRLGEAWGGALGFSIPPAA